MSNTANPIIFYAIDSPTTVDRDDAIAFDGTYLYVAIADVILPDEMLTDLTAQPETRYRPRKHIPMLPGDMETRLTLRAGKQTAFVIKLTTEGKLLEIQRQQIQIKIMTYAEAVFAMPSTFLQELFNLVAARPLQIYDFEKGLACIEGSMRSLSRYERNSGFVLIMEAMVLANRAIAGFMEEHSIPGMYRNHSAFPGSRANYGLEPTGHAGLNLTSYTHATSPLRRLPDIINWRQLRAYLDGTPFLPVEELCQKVNDFYIAQQANINSGYRERAIHAAVREMSDQDVDTVATHKEFINLLRGCLHLTEDMRQAILQRTAAKLLSVKEASLILTKQRWMGKELVQMPLDFISILMHSQQAGYIRAVKSMYESRFFCTLKSGDIVVEGEGKTKKEAQIAASRALIALLAEAGDESGETDDQTDEREQ